MLNIVTLIGRATKDIETKKTPTGKSVATFFLAVDRDFKEQGADFIKCEVWNQPADYLGNYVKKGDMIVIIGRNQSRSFKTRDGVDVFENYVLCNKVRLLSRSQSHQETIDNMDDYSSATYEEGNDLPY